MIPSFAEVPRKLQWFRPVSRGPRYYKTHCSQLGTSAEESTDMSQAKTNSQNIYDIVTVMDIKIKNLEPSPGKSEKRILILALRIMTLHSFLDILSDQNHNTAPTEAIHIS